MTSPCITEHTSKIVLVKCCKGLTGGAEHGKFGSHFLGKLSTENEGVGEDLETITSILIGRFPGKVGKVTNRGW